MQIWIRTGAVLFAATLLAACSGDSDDLALDSPEDTGTLKVVTRNGATTYYLDRHERPEGPEYKLVTAFVEAQGWEVEWEIVQTTAEVLEHLEQEKAHIAAAGLTQRDSRNERFERGPAHTEIREQLVCHRNQRPHPRQTDNLSSVEIHVTANSSYVNTLNSLGGDNGGVEFTEDSVGTEQLLNRVAQQQLQCTVADSNIVQVVRRFMPHLDIVMDLTEGQNIGWYLPKGASGLARTSRSWMNSQEGDHAIGMMENRYYSYIDEFDFVDLRALNRRIENRLPQYREYFIAAEEATDMPADLLAALAYQESHWDPHARSPTGVRGMMMLTQPTAKSVGVTNRLDAVQSIHGGARYLADRHRRLPEDIAEPDRTFLALASYNVGRGHLLDARQLARDLDKNPDSWQDMKKVLPKLADENYYPNLRYGYARGYEPVHYVRRIRNYRDVIQDAFE